MKQRFDTRLWSAALALAGLLCAGRAVAQVQVIGPEPTTVDPNMPERHTVGRDETLSILAERYLGNGDAWPKLWSFNPEVTNPHWIYPGLVLRLKPGVPLDGPQQAVSTPSAAKAAAPGLTFASRRKERQDTGAVLIGEEIYLDGEALAHAGKVVGAPEDHFMLSPTDEVYLKFKGEAAPRTGQELTLFLRQHKRAVAPPPGVHGPAPAESVKGKGEVVRVVGALRIDAYDSERKVARAVITEALEPIERGFEVTDVPRRLKAVPAKKNARDLVARVVSSSRGLGELGNEQVVFIDAGAKQGVEVGNRLWVTRQGDPWRTQLRGSEERAGATVPETNPVGNSELPVERVGELQVLYVRPESATAVIREATQELNPGDRVEMKAGY